MHSARHANAAFEIARAAEAHRADIVALSFSIAFPNRQVPALLQQLRQLLPSGVALWAGGAGTSDAARRSSVRLLASLREAIGELRPGRLPTHERQRFPGQQGSTTEQALPRLRPPDELATKMGARLA